MADIWFYTNGREQIGPFTLNELRAELERMPGAAETYVWRDGFADWEKAKNVGGLLERPKATKSIAPPPLSKRRPDQHSSVKKVKWRYALYGALGGAALPLSDYLFEWRGPKFYPWVGEGLAYNIGYFGGGMMLAALVGFLAGAYDDRLNRKRAK